MGGKSFTQMGAFFYPMSAICLPIANDIHARFSPWIFSLNCSKFAVECDWNNKTSQNDQNLGLFGKIDGLFEKNFEIFHNR